MAKHIKGNVHWVGKTDWEIRRFHGEEYSTHRGSTYNSYLIKEEKVALIDTVFLPYAKEFITNLKKEIDLDKIDYIIANHAEIDHSGALGELMKLIPGKPIYCTRAATMSLKGHYHQDWNFQVVKTGDRLDLGNGKELIFVEAPMLHWPDSMFTYMSGENILFSNDAFGQHYASEQLFNDLVDECELSAEAMKYYANILTPFSHFVREKIAQWKDLNLPLDIIAPSHGVVWRQNPGQIVEKYQAWSGDYQEKQVTVMYDTMWNGTKVMAENIVAGLKQSLGDDWTVKMFSVSRGDKNDIITEILKSKLVVAGCPTINKGILSSMSGILEEIRGLAFKKKKAAAFGSFGWSGEGAKMVEDGLRNAGFEIVAEPMKAMWSPDEEALEKCREFGRKLAESVK
jgi:anaerobic nitric oxide reductase flavorubredoxin